MSKVKKAWLTAIICVVCAAVLFAVSFYCLGIFGFGISVGRCYADENGSGVYLLDKTGPIALNFTDTKSRREFKTGDKLLIIHSNAIMESYPPQMAVYRAYKLSSGSVESLNDDELKVYDFLTGGGSALGDEGSVRADSVQEPCYLPEIKSAAGHSHEIISRPGSDSTQIALCGNSITRISDPSGREICSFYSGDSAKIYGILLGLKFEEHSLCECSPEYTVTLEGCENYYLSITKGFVRYEGLQVQLSEEQLAVIKSVFSRQSVPLYF